MPVEQSKTLEELFKSRLAQLKADSEYATGAISQSVRLVDYGLVALVFASLSSDKASRLFEHHPYLLCFAALCGAVGVFLDGLQHHAIDSCAREDRQHMFDILADNGLQISSPQDFMTLKPDLPARRFRLGFYQAKIVITLLGSVVAFIAVFAEVSGS